jgi:hypothetical protein
MREKVEVVGARNLGMGVRRTKQYGLLDLH